MDDIHFEALQAMMGRTMNLTLDLIAGVILACKERDALDIEKLREVFDLLASRPDVSTMERAAVERLLHII